MRLVVLGVVGIDLLLLVWASWTFNLRECVVVHEEISSSLRDKLVRRECVIGIRAAFVSLQALAHVATWIGIVKSGLICALGSKGLALCPVNAVASQLSILLVEGLRLHLSLYLGLNYVGSLTA